MGHSTYFYLEPYVYIASGKNGILLINMLDDNTLIFNDSRSVDIMQRLLSSPISFFDFLFFGGVKYGARASKSKPL